VRAITNAAGAKTEAALYQTFGEQSEWVLPGNAAPETKGWIGERYDADAGLQYLNARYYDPELSLFLQPDWFEVTKAGVGTNRFSYSFNDPVNGSDPNGNASVYHKDGSVTHVKPGTPEHDALDRYNSGDRSQFSTGSDLRNYLQNGGSSGNSYRNERGAYYAGYLDAPSSFGATGSYQITISTQNGPTKLLAVGPGGEPWVPFEKLPRAARYILQFRWVTADGQVALEAPLGYKMIDAPSGGGWLLVPGNWQAGDSRKNVIRIQAPGNGSADRWGYDKGYYVVYDSNAEPISIYSGKVFKDNSPAVHNPIGYVQPPDPFSIFNWF
jgi:RHS repeat-associated protein